MPRPRAPLHPTPPSALRAATSPFRGGIDPVSTLDALGAVGIGPKAINLRHPGLDPGSGFSNATEQTPVLQRVTRKKPDPGSSPG